MSTVPLRRVNGYLAAKQHLLATRRLEDVLQVTRDIVALHATDPTGPYLALHARAAGLTRQALDDALYGRRELVRVLCMRTTLHVVPSDQFHLFHQAYAAGEAAARQATYLVQAGICREPEAPARLAVLQRQVQALLAERGPCTAQEISASLPELQATIRYGLGKPYEGEFSAGSRLIPGLCELGLLVRGRPHGSWRSNLYEYAPLADWLPAVDLDSAKPHEARVWLVERYLGAFGPATRNDIQWWTGFSKGRVAEALEELRPRLAEVWLEGVEGPHLMLAEDARRLQAFPEPETPYVYLLPGLDPYIMGYMDRCRFLGAEHHAKVFDRAGNAMPTIWVNGTVVGLWGQRRDGSVTYGLFEPVDEGGRDLVACELRGLEEFLQGEYLAPRTQTPFHRGLGRTG